MLRDTKYLRQLTQACHTDLSANYSVLYNVGTVSQPRALKFILCYVCVFNNAVQREFTCTTQYHRTDITKLLQFRCLQNKTIPVLYVSTCCAVESKALRRHAAESVTVVFSCRNINCVSWQREADIFKRRSIILLK